jgi:hypothetical protein
MIANKSLGKYYWLFLIFIPALWLSWLGIQYIWLFYRAADNLVFVARDGQDRALYLLSWNGLNKLTHSGILPLSAKISPTKSTVAFTYTDVLKTTLYIGLVDIKTKELKNIDITGGSDLPFSYDSNLSFAWSPDGREIVITTPSANGVYRLILLDVVTGLVESTEIKFGDFPFQKNVYASIEWDPGPNPLASVCFQDEWDKDHCRVYSVEDFNKALYVLDSPKAQWLSDGSTIMYDCFDEQAWKVIGLCEYDLNSLQSQTLVEDIFYGVWQPDGSIAVGFDTGGEGDPTFIVVYNRLLNKAYRFKEPFWRDLFISDFDW